MKKNFKIPTIKDVAALSNVSKGTVDRVIHNRGDVSEDTRIKVLDVIESLGYKPNIYASILSSKKSYTIVVVIPNFQKGEYWQLVYDGVMKAGNYGKNLNVEIQILYYNQFDLESFRSACNQTISLNPNAVLIAPIYKDEVIKLASRLNTLSIPIIYIDTKIPDTDYLAYYGMPLFESGYLAAHLLLGEDKPGEVVSFSIDRGDDPPNDSTLNRYNGFLAYIKDNNISCNIHERSIQPYNLLYNIELFDNFFAENPGITHIITFNSRSHIISDWMEIRGITDKKLIGFDMLERNIRGLKKGYINALISEKTTVHVYVSVLSIIEYLVFNKKILKRDNYTSIDILNKYNVDYYIDFTNE